MLGQKNRIFDRVFRTLSKMTFQEKLFSAYLLLLFLLFVFFPFVKFMPTTSEIASRSVGLLSGVFFKTAFLIFLAFLALLGRNSSAQFKEMIHSTFGFKDNDHLFNFGLLWIILTALLSMSESIKVSRLATATMKVTFWHGLATFLVFVGLIYAIVMMLKEAKLLRKTNFLHIVKRKRKKDSLPQATKSVQSLFEDEENTEEDEIVEAVEDSEQEESQTLHNDFFSRVAKDVSQEKDIDSHVLKEESDLEKDQKH